MIKIDLKTFLSNRIGFIGFIFSVTGKGCRTFNTTVGVQAPGTQKPSSHQASRQILFDLLLCWWTAKSKRADMQDDTGRNCLWSGVSPFSSHKHNFYKDKCFLTFKPGSSPPSHALTFLEMYYAKGICQISKKSYIYVHNNNKKNKLCLIMWPYEVTLS